MGAHTLLQPMKTLCSTCSLRELCLPVGLRPDEFEQLDTVIKQSHRLKKGSFYSVRVNPSIRCMRYVPAFLKQRLPPKMVGIRLPVFLCRAN